MTNPTPEPRSALFICEDAPLDGLAGPNSYNRAVLDALLDLGTVVDVLVTSPRLQLLARMPLSVPGTRRLAFIHGRIARGRLVPTTAPALLRRGKSLWQRRFSAGAPASDRAVIGRQLSRRELKAIHRRARRTSYDLVVIDTVFRASAVDAVDGTRSLLVAHDIFYAREESFRANGFDVQNPLSAHAEQHTWRQVDLIAAISPADADVIASETTARTLAVLPVIRGAACAVRSGQSPPHILYIGSAAYHNVDGLQWFMRTVWPRVRELFPAAEFHVVGSIGDAVPPGQDGVVVHGRVPDVRTIAKDCRFAVNPVRMGSGLKIKMIDYFQLGLPCITTATGAEGFPNRESRPFVSAHDAEHLIHLIESWLSGSPQLEMCRGAIADYLGLFSREAALSAVAELLQSTPAEPSQP